MKNFKWIILVLPVLFFIGTSFASHSYVFTSVGVVTDEPSTILEKKIVFDNMDVPVYFARSSWVAARAIPYGHIFEEYPQWALSYISIPRLFTADYLVYRDFFVLMNGVCYLLLALFLFLILKKSGNVNRFFLLLLPSFLFFTFNRFDIFVALLIVASYYFLLNKKDYVSFSLLGFAVLTKWFPLIFLPIYFIYLFNREKIRPAKWIYLSLSFLLPIVLPLLVTLLTAGFAGLVQPYVFHFSRLVEPYSTLSFLSVSQLLLPFFFYLQLAGAILPFFWVKISNQKILILYLTLGVLFFVFFGRIYSPQFIVWFLPFLLLVLIGRELWLLVIYDIVNYITYYWSYL
ncbi:MAG: hypothetical protein JW816_03595, partial [Candidatus Buchananbacteria bacterium]|nr:hypothetical protein [Candidatus Buchananbacteria bacterium]